MVWADVREELLFVVGGAALVIAVMTFLLYSASQI
jgi:hypothetical protein